MLNFEPIIAEDGNGEQEEKVSKRSRQMAKKNSKHIVGRI